jgi:hypothetical protein
MSEYAALLSVSDSRAVTSASLPAASDATPGVSAALLSTSGSRAEADAALLATGSAESESRAALLHTAEALEYVPDPVVIPGAFTERPDCPIPFVPKLELDLIDDCDIPEAPEPIFEAPEIDPIIPPPDIGCPPIQLDVELEPLQQEYDYTYAIDPALRVQIVWTKYSTVLGTLEFLTDDPEVRVYWSVVGPPVNLYTTPLPLALTTTVYYQVFKGTDTNSGNIEITFDLVQGAPPNFSRPSGLPAKYTKPLPIVEDYAKFESDVQFRDGDYCAPDIDIEVEMPEFIVPCPVINFEPGTQEIWGRPEVEIEIEPKKNNSSDCDFDFEVNVNLPGDCVLAKNVSGVEVHAGEPLEIVGRGEDDGLEFILVDLPSDDSVAAANIVFPIATIGVDDPEWFGCVHGGISLIFVEYDGDNPDVNDEVGVQNGSKKFKKGNTGFKALAVDTANKKVWIRPLSGGGSSLTLVRAKANGAGGLILVDRVTLGPNPAAIPNFILGDESTLVYLQP